MGETATRTDDGVPKVYPTTEFFGSKTFFTGAGDDPANGLATGTEMCFHLLVTDSSQTKILTFSEDVWLRKGHIFVKGAPIGAKIDFGVYAPSVPAFVGYFGKNFPIPGTGMSMIDPDTRTLIPLGMELRVTVHNATGVGPHEPAADFYASLGLCGSRTSVL